MESKEESDLHLSSASITSSKSLPSRATKQPEEDGVSFRSYGGNLASIPASVRGSQYLSCGTYISSVCPPETSWVPENFSEFLESAFTDGSLKLDCWDDSDEEDFNEPLEEDVEEKQASKLDPNDSYGNGIHLFTSWQAISAENRFIVMPSNEKGPDGMLLQQPTAYKNGDRGGNDDSMDIPKDYEFVKKDSTVNESEYDSVQSSSSTRGLLASAARKFVVRRKSSKNIVKPNNDAKFHMRKCLKNLATLCIGFTLSFSAFFTLRNLQSSLSADSSLALLSLSIIYLTFVGASVFSGSIVEKFGHKNAIVSGLLGIAIYTACNFYPVSYIIIPASVLFGLALPNLWIAHGLYLTSLATEHATWSGKSKANAISRFNGVFFMVWHMVGILGNLASSFILYSGNVPNNGSDLVVFNNSVAMETEFVESTTHQYLADPVTINSSNSSVFLVPLGNRSVHEIDLESAHSLQLCGAAYCPNFPIQDSGMQTNVVIVRIFLGVFLAICLVGIAIIVIFLDKTSVPQNVQGTSTIKQQVFGIFKHLKDRQALMLVTLVFYLGVQQTFVFSEMTKAFVSCPYGIYKIGFLMISYGFFDAISSISSGQLQKQIGRAKLFTTAAVLNMAVLITMLLWKPTLEQEWVVYVLVGMWGLADGIWVTMTNSMVGILFMDRMKSAFASTRQIHSLGYAVSFGYSQYLCMTTKIYITMAILVVGFTMYTLLEVKLNRESQPDLKRRETYV